MTRLKMRPLHPAPSQKRKVRTQVGALCFRVRDGKPEILLITSRGTGRWVIPKGWPMAGTTPGAAAAQESWEEAGAIGKLCGDAIGVYSYVKPGNIDGLPRIVAVFPVRVKRLAETFPERGERRRKWFSPEQAAEHVREPELKHILSAFDPQMVGS